MSLVIWDNFSYQGRNPLDSRMLFDTIAAMKNYNENYLPDITLAFNKEDGKMYVFNRTNDVDEDTGKWREFEGGAGVTDYDDLLNKPLEKQADIMYAFSIDAWASMWMIKYVKEIVNGATLYEVINNEFVPFGEATLVIDGSSYSTDSGVPMTRQSAEDIEPGTYYAKVNDPYTELFKVENLTNVKINNVKDWDVFTFRDEGQSLYAWRPIEWRPWYSEKEIPEEWDAVYEDIDGEIRQLPIDSYRWTVHQGVEEEYAFVHREDYPDDDLQLTRDSADDIIREKYWTNAEASGGNIQVSELPTATAENVGKVYQYIGADTQDYKHDFFYENKYTEGTPGYYAFTLGGAEAYYATSETPSDNDPVYENNEWEITQIPLGIGYWVVDAESPSWYSIYAVEWGGQTMPTTRDSTQDIPGEPGGYQRVSVEVQEGNYDTLKNKPVFSGTITQQGYGRTVEHEAGGGQTETYDFLSLVEELPENWTISAYDLEDEELFELKMINGLAYGLDTVTRNSSLDQDITVTIKEVNEKYYDIIGIMMLPAPSSEYENKIYRYVWKVTDRENPGGVSIGFNNQDLVICQNINGSYYWTKYGISTSPVYLATYWEWGYWETNNYYNDSNTSVVSYNGKFYTGTVDWSTFQWTWTEMQMWQKYKFHHTANFDDIVTVANNENVSIKIPQVSLNNKEPNQIPEAHIHFRYESGSTIKDVGKMYIKFSATDAKPLDVVFEPTTFFGNGGSSADTITRAFNPKTIYYVAEHEYYDQINCFIPNKSWYTLKAYVEFINFGATNDLRAASNIYMNSYAKPFAVRLSQGTQVETFEWLEDYRTNTIVQYIGTTDANYTQGHFYKKTEYPNTWTEISVNASVDTLEGLTDVEITNPQEWDVLWFDSTSTKWKNVNKDYNEWPGIKIGDYIDYLLLQWPCNEWFHVPTKGDISWFGSLVTSVVSQADKGNIPTYLHMPMWGCLKVNNSGSGIGSPTELDNYMYLWTSTPSEQNWQSYYWMISRVGSISNSWNNRINAFGIRPFANEVVLPDNTWTVEYGTLGSSGIFHNATLWLITITNWETTYTISDKNLWATVVYDTGDTKSADNVGCYYQWGNNNWFLFTGNSDTSTTKIDTTWYSATNPYTSSTLIVTNIPIYEAKDWSTVDNDDLWGWASSIHTNAITNIGVLSVNGKTGHVALEIQQSLPELTDVEITNVQDWDIIAYDDASLKYKNIKNDPYIAGEGISLEPTTKTVNDYSAMRWPCPEWFHIPSWLGNLNSIINSISDYKKLHMPTNCGYWAGEWQNRNEPESWWTNLYWQTDPWTYAGEWYAWHFDEYNNNRCGSTDASATYWLPIRAFKDEVVLPDSTWTEELAGKIWHNAALGLITYFDGTDYYTMADKNVGATTVWNDGDTCTDANVWLYFQQGNNYGYHYGDTVPTTDELIDVSSVEPSTYSSATWGSTDHSSRWDEVNADIWGEETKSQQKTITKTGIQNLSMNESDVAFATVTLTGTTATLSNAFITAETFVDYIVKNGTPAGTITITVANGSVTLSSTASENLILLLRLEKVNSKSVILN